MSRTPPPRSDPRSTRELVRDGHAEDRAEHVAERLECALRRGERETRDEARDGLLADIHEDVKAILAVMAPINGPGCREECRRNTAAIGGLRRLAWLAISTTLGIGGALAVWALTAAPGR